MGSSHGDHTKPPPPPQPLRTPAFFGRIPLFDGHPPFPVRHRMRIGPEALGVCASSVEWVWRAVSPGNGYPNHHPWTVPRLAIARCSRRGKGKANLGLAGRKSRSGEHPASL